MASGPPQTTELMNSLQELFATGAYTDCTIRCHNDIYRVHKALICTRSTFFAAAFNSSMKEGITSEVNLEDDDPDAVKLMVHYLYHLDYPHLPRGGSESETHQISPNIDMTPKTQVDPVGSSSLHENSSQATNTGIALRKIPNLLHHARLYALADKYGINGLKDLATLKFRLEIGLWMNHAEFVDACWEVYTSTPAHDRGLRDIVSKTVSIHAHLVDHERMEPVLKDTGLAFDLVKANRRDSKAAKESCATRKKHAESTRENWAHFADHMESYIHGLGSANLELRTEQGDEILHIILDILWQAEGRLHSMRTDRT